MGVQKTKTNFFFDVSGAHVGGEETKGVLFIFLFHRRRGVGRSVVGLRGRPKLGGGLFFNQKMPGLIRVSEFVEETREDYNSPTTSTFVSRMPQCRQTIASLEEVSPNFFFTYLCSFAAGVIAMFITYVRARRE